MRSNQSISYRIKTHDCTQLCPTKPGVCYPDMFFVVEYLNLDSSVPD